MARTSKRIRKQIKTKTKKRKKTPKDTGLKKKYYPKTKRELCDFDYLDKLTDSEREWLNTFMEEYAKAHINHGKKRKLKKHQIKEVYRQNNARNRDMWNKYQKVDLGEVNISEFIDVNTPVTQTEDVVVELLDINRKIKK